MKYKVSLLPESRRKLLNGKKRIEQIQKIALVLLILLFGLLLIVVGIKFYADKKLSAAQLLDNEYSQRVTELEKYRQINAELEKKVALFDAVKVEQPYLYQFLVKLGNMDHPGLDISGIDCTDWKVTRVCTITGNCDTRQEYLDYEKALGELEDVASVTNQSYTSGVGTEGGRASFTVQLTVSGGKADVAIEQAETAPFAETTIIDSVAVE